MSKGFVYLASPYTHQDAFVREVRYLEAAKAMQFLLAEKIWVYSPIVHCHELAKTALLPREFRFWREYNIAMLGCSSMMAVLQLPGWEKSEGLKDELQDSLVNGRPIEYISEGPDIRAVCDRWEKL